MDADAAKAQPLVLRLAPLQIDKLDFYQLVDGQWQATLAGDRQPKRLNPCLDDRICFILNPTGKDTITVYLRLQTHDFPVVTVDLVPSSDLMAGVGTGANRCRGKALVELSFRKPSRTAVAVMKLSYISNIIELWNHPQLSVP